MVRYLLTGIVGYLAGAPITVWLTDHAGGFLHSLLPIFPGYVAAGALVYGGVGCVEFLLRKYLVFGVTNHRSSWFRILPLLRRRSKWAANLPTLHGPRNRSVSQELDRTN